MVTFYIFSELLIIKSIFMSNGFDSKVILDIGTKVKKKIENKCSKQRG